MQSRRIHWSWVALGLGLLAAVGLAGGCGGAADDGGDANYSQKFEKPTGPAPVVKAAPVRKSPKDANELSPRERRALNKSEP